MIIIEAKILFPIFKDCPMIWQNDQTLCFDWSTLEGPENDFPEDGSYFGDPSQKLITKKFKGGSPFFFAI